MTEGAIVSWQAIIDDVVATYPRTDTLSQLEAIRSSLPSPNRFTISDSAKLYLYWYNQDGVESMSFILDKPWMNR